MNHLHFTIALLLYFVLHSLLASPTAKTTLERYAKTNYRLFYNIFAILTLLPLVYFYLSLAEVSLFQYGGVVRLFGLLVALAGGLVMVRAMRQYDLKAFAGLQEESRDGKPPQLVLTGMNAWIRHPLYFGMLLFFWGFFIYQADLKALILAIVLSLYLIVGVELEEQKLIETFGDKYRHYQQQVPALLPWEIPTSEKTK